jgi:hypothetical protein
LTPVGLDEEVVVGIIDAGGGFSCGGCCQQSVQFFIDVFGNGSFAIGFESFVSFGVIFVGGGYCLGGVIFLLGMGYYSSLVVVIVQVNFS